MAEREIKLPDIGDFDDVEVIELLVTVGDRVAVEQSLLVLESDKATMEIPSPVAGVVRKLLVGVGDEVSEGTPIAMLDVEEAARKRRRASPRRRPRRAQPPAAAGSPAAQSKRPSRSPRPRSADLAPYTVDAPHPAAHAGPSVRRLARELGVDLALRPGPRTEGPHPRRRRAGLREGADRPGRRRCGRADRGRPRRRAAWTIDFAKFGPTEIEALNRVRRVAAANLHRSLGHRPARHAVRRRRRHRARELPPGRSAPKRRRAARSSPSCRSW